MPEAKGSPYATPVSNEKGCCVEQEQDTRRENSLDPDNPSPDLNCKPQTPALAPAIHFDSDLVQYPKLGFAQTADPTTNLNDPAQPSAYPLGNIISDHHLYSGFDETNRTSGYDYSFDWEVGCSSDLALRLAPNLSQATSLRTDSNNCTIPSGYDYSHGFLVNTSCRDVFHDQGSTINQNPSTPIVFSNGIQASGYDYDCSVVTNPGTNLTGHRTSPLTQTTSLPAGLGNQMQISGYEYIQDLFTDPRCNRSQYFASLSPNATLL
jgi:hypothetical protein